MKFLLFRILLLHRTRDRGFTLPMVIGIGLIMILLSSVALVQSSEENLTSISKDQSSTSLAMAELGVARYRELINNNRVLAVNSLGNWTAVADQTCDVITDGNGDDGWANNTDWRPVEVDENAPNPPIDFNNDGDAIDTDAEIGSYRIVDYVYQIDTNPVGDADNGFFDQTSDLANRTDPTDPETGPRGILTVQGRDKSGGVAQIQVTIPIGVNTEDLNTLDPAIWIHQESATNFGIIRFEDGAGNATLLGNLVLYRQTDGNDRCADINIPMDGEPDVEAIRDPRDLPPLATLPGNFNAFNGDINQNNVNEPLWANPNLILGKLNATVPPNVDSDGVERYYYQVIGNLDIDGPENLLADGTAKVVLFVEGDLDINSGFGVVNIGNTSIAATSSFFEIYVTGNVNIDGVNDVNINGLIRADGTVTIAGDTTVKLKGSIWANGLNNSGIIEVIRDVDEGEDAYKYYSTTLERTPRPLTYPPTGWEQQEVD